MKLVLMHYARKYYKNEIDYFIQAQAEGDLVLTGSNSKDRESKYFRPKEDNKDEL